MTYSDSFSRTRRLMLKVAETMQPGFTPIRHPALIRAGGLTYKSEMIAPGLKVWAELDLTKRSAIVIGEIESDPDHTWIAALWHDEEGPVRKVDAISDDDGMEVAA
jgi:hypothetical protein